jgi:hypothetical protein
MVVFSIQLCVLLPLSPSLWLNSPPPLPVWISILYTRIHTHTGGGYGVLGLRQINTCRKVPLQVNIFRLRHLHICIAFYESIFLAVHSSVWSIFKLHITVGKFGSCTQWRGKLLDTEWFFFSIDKAQVTLCAIGRCTRTYVAPFGPARTHLIFPIPTAEWIFSAPMGIRFLIANNCKRWRVVTLKVSHKMGVWRIFLRNLRASPYKENLLIITTFSKSHLDGPYL